jgi:hypothetical protein
LSANNLPLFRKYCRTRDKWIKRNAKLLKIPSLDGWQFKHTCQGKYHNLKIQDEEVKQYFSIGKFFEFLMATNCNSLLIFLYHLCQPFQPFQPDQPD